MSSIKVVLKQESIKVVFPKALAPAPSSLTDLVEMLITLPKYGSDEAAVSGSAKIYIAKNHVSAPDGAIMVSTLTL